MHNIYANLTLYTTFIFDQMSNHHNIETKGKVLKLYYYASIYVIETGLNIKQKKKEMIHKCTKSNLV